MEPKDGRLRIGDPFGPARPSDDDESSSWPSPTSRGTKRGRDIVGGSDATERSERFVADVDMLRICVSAEKLRDRRNDDDVLDADSPLWPLFTESPPEWRRGLARECLLAWVPGSKSGSAGISESGVSCADRRRARGRLEKCAIDATRH